MPDPGWKGAVNGERRTERMDGPVKVSGRQNGEEEHQGGGRDGKLTETQATKEKKRNNERKREGRREGCRAIPPPLSAAPGAEGNLTEEAEKSFYYLSIFQNHRWICSHEDHKSNGDFEK
jgi:hypothetical protein